MEATEKIQEEYDDLYYSKVEEYKKQFDPILQAQELLDKLNADEDVKTMEAKIESERLAILKEHKQAVKDLNELVTRQMAVATSYRFRGNTKKFIKQYIETCSKIGVAVSYEPYER